MATQHVETILGLLKSEPDADTATISSDLPPAKRVKMGSSRASTLQVERGTMHEIIDLDALPDNSKVEADEAPAGSIKAASELEMVKAEKRRLAEQIAEAKIARMELQMEALEARQASIEATFVKKERY